MSLRYEKGAYIPTGGALPTRDMCINGRNFAPYLDRAFTPDLYIPQMGRGAENIDNQVSLDTDITFPYYTRVRKGCTDELEFDVDLTFDFLPYKWQQDDYRPIHFMEDTRLAVKDWCRTRPCAHGGQDYLQCAYENDNTN